MVKIKAKKQMSTNRIFRHKKNRLKKKQLSPFLTPPNKVSVLQAILLVFRIAKKAIPNQLLLSVAFCENKTVVENREVVIKKLSGEWESFGGQNALSSPLIL